MSKELEYIQRQIDIVKQQVKGSNIKIIVTDTVTKHKYDYYERELQTLESIEQALNRLKSIENAEPSEALECLEFIENKLRGLRVECERIKNHRCDDVFIQEHTFDTIKQALLKAQEQEKVIKELCEYCGMDNLYPYDNLEEIEITFKDTFDNYSRQRIESLGRLNKLEKENAELRQKAQEPKHYLKWEDLEFKEEEQTMKVLLNGEEYKLSYFTDGITEYVDLLAGNGKYQMGRYVDCYPTDVKFFNDLHLEEILKEGNSE